MNVLRKVAHVIEENELLIAAALTFILIYNMQDALAGRSGLFIVLAFAWMFIIIACPIIPAIVWILKLLSSIGKSK